MPKNKCKHEWYKSQTGLYKCFDCGSTEGPGTETFALVPLHDIARLEEARKELCEIFNRNGLRAHIGGSVTSAMYKVANRNYHQVIQAESCHRCDGPVTHGRRGDLNIYICNDWHCREKANDGLAKDEFGKSPIGELIETVRAHAAVDAVNEQAFTQEKEEG